MKDQARLALVYVSRVEAGERNPARALAARYEGASEKTWLNRFGRLRSLGLLTAAPRRGVAGGELTDRATELLSGPSPTAELIAAYKAGAEALPLSDAQVLELAGLPDYDLRGWLATNPTAGVEDFESWWNREIFGGDASETNS